MRARQELSVTIRLAPSAVLACLLAWGCGGYRPIQWPKRELWVATPEDQAPVFPSDDISKYPDRLEQQGVQVAIELIDAARARAMFQLSVHSMQVQPLMLVIQNDSADTYSFRKTDVEPPYVPAKDVVQRAFVHPYYSAFRTARWIALLPVGVLVTSIIEPLTTIDFPGLEELVRRPAPVNRPLMDELVDREIRDWDIPPKTSLGGLIFIRPPKPGGDLAVTLVNLHTRTPVIVKTHAYAPSLSRAQIYPYSRGDVWQALGATVQEMSQWSVVQTDQAAGVMQLRREFHFLSTKTTTQMRIVVRQASTGYAQVEVDAGIGGFDLTWRRTRSRSVDAFMDRLGDTLARDYRRLPPLPKPQPQAAAGVQSTAGVKEPVPVTPPSGPSTTR